MPLSPVPYPVPSKAAEVMSWADGVNMPPSAVGYRDGEWPTGMPPGPLEFQYWELPPGDSVEMKAMARRMPC